MPTTSEQPDARIVLQPSSTNTPPRVLSIPVSQHHARLPSMRIAAIDLRIGLNMLGIEGRKLLAEYLEIKRQEKGNDNDH